MAIEIVDFPIENGGYFHSYVAVYQRVTISTAIPVKKNIWFSKPLSRQGCPLPHSGLKATRGAVNGSVGAFTNRNWRSNGEK